MFLLYDLYKTNKLIKEKEKRLDLDQYAMQERTIKNYKKANKDELKKYNEFLINVKKELEDKVKSILIAITISTTLSFNFVKFIQEYLNNNIYIYYIAFAFGIIVLIYMALAGILALYSISEINQIAINKPDESKKQISNNIEFNILQNIKRNNYMNTSYKYIYRALIIFILFILMSFTYIIMNKKF